MENSLTPVTLISVNNHIVSKIESIHAKYHKIIQQCDTSQQIYGKAGSSGAHYSQKSYSVANNKPNYHRSKLPQYIFDPHQPNPQARQQINKEIQKVTIQLKRLPKPPTIRKTDIGENEQVFTKEEQMKLQIIDQFLQKGFSLPNDPFNMELYPRSNTQEIDLQNFVKNGKMAEIQMEKNKEELIKFKVWGQNGNQREVMAIVDNFTRNHVEGIDLDGLNLQSKQKKRKQAKILNFNYNNKCSIQPKKVFAGNRKSLFTADGKINKREKASLFKQVETHILTEQSIDLNKIGELSNLKKDENSTNCVKLKKSLRKQNINKLILSVARKYSLIKPQIYMTNQRIEALYYCDLIKGAKQLMSHKDYVNLKLVVENSQKNKKNNLSQPFYFGPQDKNKQNIESLNCKDEQKIDKIIQRNKERLKYEKLRIIEKLRC